MAGPQYNPAFGQPQGMPQQVNWGSSVMPQQNPWATAGVPTAPDVAGANANAAALAAQQGIANQKNEEALDALSKKYEFTPRQAAIQKQLQTADAIRSMGRSLNTGSVNGGAPNWMGALANVAGAYFGKKQQDEAQEAAKALGGEQGAAARTYYNAAPTQSTPN